MNLELLSHDHEALWAKTEARNEHITDQISADAVAELHNSGSG
jgi:hypothetical protein